MAAAKKRRRKKKELEKLNVKVVFGKNTYTEEENIQTLAKFFILLSKGALREMREKEGVNLCSN